MKHVKLFWYLQSVRNCFQSFVPRRALTAMSMGQLKETEIEPGVIGLELIEGKAKVHLEKNQGVFYNPVQCFNRDISTAVINEHLRLRKNFIQESKKTTWDVQATILEALAASGLRSIRYGLELDSDLVKEIVANDISKSAVDSIRKNAQLNNVHHLVKPNFGDAILYMHQCKADGKMFDVVDLDPYGCAGKFLDPAVQCIQNKGLLCVTATDMAILCGNTPETCRAKYGSASLRTKYCHEMALRILLASIETAANRHGRYIIPLLSVSVDFYIRVFVQVDTSPHKVKQSSSKLSLVYSCNGCENFYFQPMGVCIENGSKTSFKNARGPPTGSHCDNCGSTFTFGGPIYTDRIHNFDFVTSLQKSLSGASQLETTVLPDFEANGANLHQNDDSEKEKSNEQPAANPTDDDDGPSSNSKATDGAVSVTQPKFQTLRRMQGILNVISEELPDVPLHHTQERLCQVLKTQAVPMIKLRSALLHAGYKVSLSHTNKTSVKTDAPHHVVWDIMRHWVKEQKDEKQRDKAGTTVMGHEIKTEVNLCERPDATAPSMKDKSLRYQINPERNWGPKARATAAGEIEEKRKRLQGKKKRRNQQNSEKIDGNATESETKKIKHEQIPVDTPSG